MHLDITRGPVTPIAHQLDAADARELTLSQLDRARLARAADRERRPVDLADPAAEHQRPTRRSSTGSGSAERDLIGGGGESEVYALGSDRVLRIYRATHEAPAAMIGQLRPLYAPGAVRTLVCRFRRSWTAGEIGGRWFSVDRRMSGRQPVRLAGDGRRRRSGSRRC